MEASISRVGDGGTLVLEEEGSPHNHLLRNPVWEPAAGLGVEDDTSLSSAPAPTELSVAFITAGVVALGGGGGVALALEGGSMRDGGAFKYLLLLANEEEAPPLIPLL